ncbi:hypothetical protein SAMN00120144_0909 [Hymenobacter roseosalivarius DSM 11622]|uniref:Uncharacterized protein n=1 Tax=Hymenobacter roseosalivarius DSM 11622 TaxID=645990 RepID=A0A1W1V8G2_9BACT|nr:hypothetical protein [Hymenobacter roseosalivarius]SMB89321.1 hypothetical protein SAMN00120144_0909 [Hymenobacter roseosalivarius DSM 11622]
MSLMILLPKRIASERRMTRIKWKLAQLLALVGFVFNAPLVSSQNQSPKQGATVYVFLAETCPTSQQAMLALRDLNATRWPLLRLANRWP